MTTTGIAIARDFFDVHGVTPVGVWSAPGRVNLMGEHTDYNHGRVLPLAIDRRTSCAVAPRTDRTMTVSSSLRGTPQTVSLDDLSPERMVGWSAYVFGVVWALARGGVDLESRPGFDMMVDSDVPVGAGLSSSAALECAVAVALNDMWELGLTPGELVRVCQLAENGAVGAPTGIMDQSASLFGKRGQAVLLDCATEVSETVPLRLEEQGLALVVIDTRIAHDHATGGYSDRRSTCERSASALGVAALGELAIADLARAQALLDEESFRRVRHVVTENARVGEVVAALAGAGPRSIGPILAASHASMRDDFEISVPELDLAVNAATDAGAVGARMTGGGFGGSAIAIAPVENVRQLLGAVESAFEGAGFTAPCAFVVHASDGARRDE